MTFKTTAIDHSAISPAFAIVSHFASADRPQRNYFPHSARLRRFITGAAQVRAPKACVARRSSSWSASMRCGPIWKAFTADSMPPRPPARLRTVTRLAFDESPPEVEPIADGLGCREPVLGKQLALY
jgi:hypothetical protein